VGKAAWLEHPARPTPVTANISNAQNPRIITASRTTFWQGIMQAYSRLYLFFFQQLIEK
jgi:hypothetical protein